jgi:hypothetical protein
MIINISTQGYPVRQYKSRVQGGFVRNDLFHTRSLLVHLYHRPSYKFVESNCSGYGNVQRSYPPSHRDRNQTVTHLPCQRTQPLFFTTQEEGNFLRQRKFIERQWGIRNKTDKPISSIPNHRKRTREVFDPTYGKIGGCSCRGLFHQGRKRRRTHLRHDDSSDTSTFSSP